MKIFTFYVISEVICFGIAIILIFIVKTKKPAMSGLTFSELLFDYTNLPKLESFKAREGSSLNYRYYPSQSDKIIVLIDGSGRHSRYFQALAKFISSEGLAQVRQLVMDQNAYLLSSA